MITEPITVEAADEWLRGRVWWLEVCGVRFKSTAKMSCTPKRPSRILLEVDHDHTALPYVPCSVDDHFAAQIAPFVPGYQFKARCFDTRDNRWGLRNIHVALADLDRYNSAAWMKWVAECVRDCQQHHARRW